METYNPNYASVWIATTSETAYPPLPGDMSVEVAVVGGGIAGLSTAILLQEKGVKVVLLEAERIVQKTTGNTTAKLTSLHGLKYARLLDLFAEEGVRMYAQANQAAISEVERLVEKYVIDCDCLPTSAYTYADAPHDRKLIEKEVDATQKLGLPATFTTEVPLPFKTYGAIKFTDQLQFHVRKFLLGIAKAFTANGGDLFEHTKVQTILEQDGEYSILTDKGKVHARTVVIATHAPFYDPDKLYVTMQAFRDYALGILLNEPTPQGMFFSTGEDPYSIRYQQTPQGDIVILGGGWDPEKTATNPDAHFTQQQERYAKKLNIKEVRYRWYTHDYITDDEVPVIGRLSKHMDNLFVTTGFAGWGMTTGVAAGMILSDLITRRENQ